MRSTGPQTQKWNNIILNANPVQEEIKLLRDKKEPFQSSRIKPEPYNFDLNLGPFSSNNENEAAKHYQQQNEYLRQHSKNKLIKTNLFYLSNFVR